MDSIQEIGRGIIKKREELLAGKGEIPPQLWRKSDEFSQLALLAALRAVKNAGIKKESLALDRTAVVLFTQNGPIESKKRFVEEIYKYGIHLASPMIFPNTVMNMAAGMIAMFLGIKGPNLTFVDNEDLLNKAIKTGKELIEFGRADLVIAGTVDLTNDVVIDIEEDPGERKHGAEIVVLSKGLPRA